jgi:hypothetical protein
MHEESIMFAFEYQLPSVILSEAKNRVVTDTLDIVRTKEYTRGTRFFASLSAMPKK